jgi:hypothetical protein
VSTPTRLTDEQRGQLLRDLTTLRTDDDDAVQQDPKWFLPLDAHGHALRPETLVVRGGRGAGKSALFHFLGHIERDPSLGKYVLIPQSATRWIEGYSNATLHPGLAVVGEFARTATDDQMRFFWFGWLCAQIARLREIGLPGSLIEVAVDTKNPAAIAKGTQEQLVKLTTWLDEQDRTTPFPIVVSYDSLDRIEGAAANRRGLASSLLAMWLSLGDRYRRIRPKIFIREDLFQGALAAFPDASKLDARSVSLEWRVEDLYRVLIKHMANISDGLKRWIEESSRRIPLTYADALGWTPPRSLSEDTGMISQKGFVDHLAGEFMGIGDKKGLTYRWIPNRLQDAHARVVPRSILNLVRNAAHDAIAHTPKAQYQRILHPQELYSGLEQTSRRRTREVVEEFPVVDRLGNLRGQTVMIERSTVVDALSKPPQKDDGFGDDGEAVVRILIDLGVMSERTDKRIDIPDIYRYGFGILRKGGVKRPH